MNSDKFTPRLLGMMFIVVAVVNIIGDLILGSLGYTIIGPPDNISETMIKISDNPTTMLMGIVIWLFTAAGIVLLAVLLYTTLKKQNNIIARWAFGLWILEAATVAVRTNSFFSLLRLSQGFVKAGAPDPSYFQTHGSLFYESTQFSYSVLMIFYCLGGILFYYLFLKSKYVPTVLALFGIIAASLGFIGTLLVLFNYDVPMYVFLPILPFELAIGVWLMVKGFRPQEVKS